MYDGSLAQYESILMMIFVHPLILSSLYLHDFSYTLFIYVPVYKLFICLHFLNVIWLAQIKHYYLMAGILDETFVQYTEFYKVLLTTILLLHWYII